MANTDLIGFEAEMSRQLLLGEMLARNARKCPDVEGIIFRDKRVTYRELDERVNRLANALLLKGIKKGDNVGLLMPNSKEMLDIFFATAKMGAVNVPVNIRLSPPEIAYILNNAGVRTLFFRENFIETVEKIKGDLPLIEKYILINGEGGGRYENYEDVLSTGHPVRPEVRLQDDDEAFIIYTAGTTGKPKGAVLTHKNLIINAMTTCQETAFSLPRRPDLPFITQKVMSITPFFHIAGILSVVKNMVTLTPMVI